MNKKPLTVTALNKYIKYCFDNDINLQNVYLKGEVSNFKHHSRGHFYFTLKDESSQINAIMFSSNAKNIDFKIEDGMKVIVEGYVTLFLQTGDFQIYVSNIIIDGLGALYLRFEQLKEKLLKEGLFHNAHKKVLPRIPKKIGVITSDTGAAIRDILTTLERRFPLVKVTVFPTIVQGEYAKNSIVDSINKANLDPSIDLIILGRGGGSIEDLWCFNEEIVARAIFASKIPIISAIGHETDFTISDFVSDLRAPTPTAAAELAVPNKNDLFFHLNHLNERMIKSLNHQIENKYTILNKINKSYIFNNPRRLFDQNYYKTDKLYALLQKHNPKSLLDQKMKQLDNLSEKMNYLYEKKYQMMNHQFTHLISKLELLNPLNILKKGYSITKKEEIVVDSIEKVAKDEKIDVYVKDGVINCMVKSKEVKTYD